MRILAIQSVGHHDASAAAFDDYNLVAAVAEERLTREKGWGGGLPWLAIDEVLRIASWTRRDVDVVVAMRGRFPSRYLKLSSWADLFYRLRGRGRPEHELSTWCQRARTTDTLAVFDAARFLADNGFRADARMHFVNHHDAHASAALFFTDWDDALIYTSDGMGDGVSYSMRHLKDGRLQCFYGDDRWLLSRYCPGGLATAYGYATMAAGFRMFRHEGKLTGLAAYGEPALAPEFGALFSFDDETGLIETPFRKTRQMRAAVLALCAGKPREVIAASAQKMIEDVTMRSVGHWLKCTGARRLALAGGLFANVRLNRLLAEQQPVDEVFIFPAMGDDGLPVGAALAFLRERDGLAVWLKQRRRLSDVYFGRDFSGEVDESFAKDARVRRLDGDPVVRATELVRAGKAGAVYDGRMEYGPRALGARSIIASPHDAAINDNLNARLDRSEFMPFAPYVLEEDAARVFEIGDVNRYAARFMTITCAVRPEWRARIPAVVHVDGTARPQVVDDARNPLFAMLLRRFRDETGLPVLINTSFNVHEEPIVNSPQECLAALTGDRVDFVVTKRAVYVKT